MSMTVPVAGGYGYGPATVMPATMMQTSVPSFSLAPQVVQPSTVIRGGSLTAPVAGQVAGMQMQGASAAATMASTANGGPSLTAGIPDPSSIQKQKDAFARNLEIQLKKGVEMLSAAHQKQTDMLHEMANKEKERFHEAMDQQVKQQEMALATQYNENLLQLQQAAQALRAQLETQASNLTLEYQQRKVQEDFMAQQAGIQRQHYDAQQRLAAEMKKLGGQPALHAAFPAGTTTVPSFNIASEAPVAQYTGAAQYAGVRPAMPYAAPSAPIQATTVRGFGTPVMGGAPGGGMPFGYGPPSYMPQGLPGSYVPAVVR